MAVRYIKTKQTYFIKGEMKEKCRARILRDSPMRLDELATNISHATTVSRPDVLAVLAALEEEIANAVLNGRPVKLEHLGSFTPSITAKVCDKAKDVTPETIEQFSCKYTPSKYMKKKFEEVHYQLKRVASAKDEGKD